MGQGGASWGPKERGWSEKVFPIMRGGVGMGQDKTMRGGEEDPILRPCPAPYGFVLPHLCPVPHDGENFPTPFPSLGTPQSPTHSHKTLLFVNLPFNQYNFFNETHFINKSILEITTKFIPSNQINFQKKLNNISKCLTRQSSK